MWGKAIYPVHTYHSLPSATGSDARNQEQEEGGVMPACSSPTLSPEGLSTALDIPDLKSRAKGFSSSE